MLLLEPMKLLGIAALLMPVLAAADPAPRGPDFVGHVPVPGVDRSLAASDGKTPIAPLDVLVFDHACAGLIPSAIAQIDTAARWLRNHPSFKIVLEGHTDALGSDPYNSDLATQRVEAVRHHLMSWGIHSDRIVMVIYGDTEATKPENPTQRRVVMFASDRPVRQIAAASLDHRRALAAVWTDRGTLFQEHNGLGEKPAAAVASRR